MSMGAFSRTGRGRRHGALGLVVLYAFATILAQAAHRHHTDDDQIPVREAGCDDPGSHWAGHTHTPDLSQPSEACPACQQRAEQQLWLQSPPLFLPTISVPHVAAAITTIPCDPVSRISCRGPPRG